MILQSWAGMWISTPVHVSALWNVLTQGGVDLTAHFPLCSVRNICSYWWCVSVCPPPLHAVCPPGNLPGPHSCRPAVPGSHGDMAGGHHNNLQASSERSRGANDRLATVTRMQALHHLAAPQLPTELPRCQGPPGPTGIKRHVDISHLFP